MNIGNINQNIAGQSINTGKASFNKASAPRDTFVKSLPTQPEPSLKNLVQTFSASDAGKVLLKDTMEITGKKIIDEPAWKIAGGIQEDTGIVYDPNNKCIYCAPETKDSSGKKKHKLTCLNNDGSVRWEAKHRGAVTSGPYLDRDGNVHFAGKNEFSALDKDGKKKWNFKIDGTKSLDGMPVVSGDGTVILVTKENDPARFRERTLQVIKNGKLSWTAPAGIAGTIITGKDGSIWIASLDETNGREPGSRQTTPEYYIKGLNPDGTEKFRVIAGDLPGLYSGSLSEGPDGTVYSLQNDGFIKAYSTDGSKTFSIQLKEKGKAGSKDKVLYPRYPPVIDESGNLYIIAGKGPTDCLISLGKDGKELWRYESGDKFECNPHLMPDGNIATLMGDGNIHIFNRKGTHLKHLVTSGEHLPGGASGSEEDRGEVNYRFASDENGRIFVSSGNRTMAFDTGVNLENRLKESADKPGESSPENGIIRMEEENVIIGGVKVKKNRVE